MANIKRHENAALTVRELQQQVRMLQSKNAEMFRFWSDQTKQAEAAVRAAKEAILEAQEGAKQSAAALDRILYEVVKVSGPIDIPIPKVDLSESQKIDVQTENGRLKISIYDDKNANNGSVSVKKSSENGNEVEGLRLPNVSN